MSDIEIARAATAQPIGEIAKKAGIPDEALMPYGKTKAKIDPEYIASLQDKPDGKLILVTAITPTPAGEGKTTTSVGLHDGLCRIGKNSIVCAARTQPRPLLWYERRCRRRRPRAGDPDGRHQPAFHRRFSRHRRRAQPAVGAGR